MNLILTKIVKLMKQKKNIFKKSTQKTTHSNKIESVFLTDVLVDFSATSSSSSALWAEKSIYPKFRTGFAFTADMKGEIVEKFNTQTFTLGSAISKVLYSNPSDSIIQYLLVREKARKTEIKRMKNGYFIDILTYKDSKNFFN